MSLRRVAVRVSPEEAEIARAALLELSPTGFEEVEREGEIELAAYTDDAGEARLRAHFGAMTGEDVAPDWSDRWRAFHKPVRVGPLWIGPPWDEPDPELIPVVIEPAQAFGTGAHPTTRLTLELLLELPRGSVLDVGCGSGVLSVAAAKLGFGPILAVDYDPVAVDATRANARDNGVQFESRVADALVDELPETDIVLANVSEWVLEALARRLSSRYLIASGFLIDQIPPLAGFTELDRREEDGWIAICAGNRAAGK
ncbi:MAG: ribosomal protein methyltransferase [Gaiellaceae bacterium]|nr:ribosomal protein methyltransferase [Gaiellaceae bacterium]